MDEIKDEPPANEDEDDGRGAWNTVQLGTLFIVKTPWLSHIGIVTSKARNNFENSDVLFLNKQILVIK